jgi:hypothetical protein
MRVQAFNFILIPFGAVTYAYFRRELNYKPFFLASVLSSVTTFVVALSCALAGLSYMSLAWSSLAGVVVTVAVAMLMRPKGLPRLPGLAAGPRAASFGKQRPESTSSDRSEKARQNSQSAVSSGWLRRVFQSRKWSRVNCFSEP